MNLIQGDEHGLVLQDYLDILADIDKGSYELNGWQTEFVEGNYDATHLSPKQRDVVLELELKFLKKG